MLRRAIVVFALLTALPASAASRQPPPPETAVRQVLAKYIAGWNRADAKMIAANFTDDGDLINPNGVHAAGRAAIEAYYAGAFAAGYRGSEARFALRTWRRIAPETIVVDGEWLIAATHAPGGQPQADERGIATVILTKTSAGWRVAAVREQTSADKIVP